MNYKFRVDFWVFVVCFWVFVVIIGFIRVRVYVWFVGEGVYVGVNRERVYVRVIGVSGL